MTEKNWLALGMVFVLSNLIVACSDLSAPSRDAGPPDSTPINSPDAQTSTDANSPSASKYPPNFVDLVAHSAWIFRGTVAELHATTEQRPFPDPDMLWDLDKMVIAKIDRVSVEPLEAPLVAGSSDTIILKQSPEPEFAVGTQAYFFVTWLLAGRSWVFVEQGHLGADRVGFEEFHAKVHETKRYLLDRALYERMLGAERVIRGTVISTEDLPGDPIGDNASDWWVGTFQPQDTLRGPVDTASIQVRYQASDSQCCYQMPRLLAGKEQILLLYPDTVTGHPGPELVVTDPLDVEAPGELERMRSLLASPPQSPTL